MGPYRWMETVMPMGVSSLHHCFVVVKKTIGTLCLTLHKY